MTTLPPPDPLDDDGLGALVRDAAGSWTIPAVRLDAPGWRERVRTPRARRIASLRGAFGRLGQAAAAAIALTVGAALLGVWLTVPRDGGKPSAIPGGSQSPRPSEVAASPMPQLFVQGAPPSPSRLLVKIDANYATVDLGTGTVGHSIVAGAFGSDLRADADGSFSCLCLAGDGLSTGGYARVQVSLVRYDAGGTETSTTAVDDFRGTPDPRDGVTIQSPDDVSVAISHGTDPLHAYVGWSFHAHPVWHSGIDVVEIASGRVIQRLAFTDRGDGEGNQRVSAGGPSVLGAAGDGRLIIAQPWASWSPPASQNALFQFGTDVFGASASGGKLVGLSPFDPARECGQGPFLAGARPDGAGTWLGCASASDNQSIVRLVGSDGAVTDLHVAASLFGGGEPGGTSALSPDGRSLYFWNPTALVVTRIDLKTGDIATGAATVAAAPVDPLAALGRWLAPTAAAKVLLSSGIAISPDGSTIYTLGVDPGGAASRDLPGSTGVLVFDAATLANVARWTPTADFVSLAVSPDGRFVYAAGSPQFSASGQATNQPASVTVFDAPTGSIRLVAGDLGAGFLTFPSTILP